jgi:hypothetical protein
MFLLALSIPAITMKRCRVAHWSSEEDEMCGGEQAQLNSPIQVQSRTVTPDDPQRHD